MSKLKAAHLSNVDNTIGLFLRPQLRALQGLGFEVHAVCPKGEYYDNILKSGYHHHHIKVTRDIDPKADLILLLRLYKLFRNQKFDVVHAHSAKLEFFGQVAAWLAGIRTIFYTNHGIIFRSDMGRGKRRLLRFLAWISGKISNHIFSQSAEDIEYAVKMGVYAADKISYLGNGINIKDFDSRNYALEQINSKKAQLNIEKSAIVVGMIARYVYEKGYIEFVEAAKKIVESNPEVHFLCVGNKINEERDAFAFDDGDPVIRKHFTVLYSQTNMPLLYACMDMVVLPSHREGFPRTLLEGASMSKPLIASDIPGCREAVNDNDIGILVPVKDAEALSRAIEAMIQNKERRREIGLAGRRKAEAEFDESKVVERLLNQYSKHFEFDLQGS
jgi:glycosyltransferase involved in cell wall biosynthesis